MLTDSPYRRLRQILAQIENKTNALRSQFFAQQKLKLDIKEWEEEDTPLSRIKIAEARSGMANHKKYIEGISQGNAEYMEQYGIHLQTARNYIKQYIDQCEGLIAQKNYPTIDHLYEFFDNCVKVFGEEYIKVMHHIGITELVRNEWLFKNNVNK